MSILILICCSCWRVRRSSLQVGLARVSGQVVFEASGLSDPTVTVNVNSNEQGAEYASMSFSPIAAQRQLMASQPVLYPQFSRKHPIHQQLTSSPARIGNPLEMLETLAMLSNV